MVYCITRVERREKPESGRHLGVGEDNYFGELRRPISALSQYHDVCKDECPDPTRTLRRWKIAKRQSCLHEDQGGQDGDTGATQAYACRARQELWEMFT